MMEEVINGSIFSNTAVVAAISSSVSMVISSWITRIIERRRYLAETVSKEQAAIKAMLGTYQTALDDMSERLNKSIIDSRQREKEFLEREAVNLEKINELDEEIMKLKTKIASLITKSCVNSRCLKRDSIENIFDEMT